VTLTQVNNDVKFDVVLTNGNRFVETGAGANALFLFNDTLTNSTITNISATLNGNNITLALTGLTNQSPMHADGTGDFTAAIQCVDQSGQGPCNGGSIPTFNDLHFTVTNATLAQLEIGNAGGGTSGNMFVADILCGTSQTQCANPKTGPVDVSIP